ncbi:MAG: hypothetical protein MZV70_46060 [Desulfobacterales bacterium]|nr:hypothetical protein [Desulfobacterales bacterium]
MLRLFDRMRRRSRRTYAKAQGVLRKGGVQGGQDRAQERRSRSTRSSSQAHMLLAETSLKLGEAQEAFRAYSAVAELEPAEHRGPAQAGHLPAAGPEIRRGAHSGWTGSWRASRTTSRRCCCWPRCSTTTRTSSRPATSSAR